MAYDNNHRFFRIPRKSCLHRAVIENLGSMQFSIIIKNELIQAYETFEKIILEIN